MRQIVIPGGIVPVSPEVSSEEIAVEILGFLYAEPWVQLFYSESDSSTQWTVLERDSHGIPLLIGSEEFDGTVEILKD